MVTPSKPKFAVGDAVTFTNDNGVVFPGKRITEIDLTSYRAQKWGPHYYYAPTETPWYSVREDQLQAEEGTPRLPPHWGSW